MYKLLLSTLFLLSFFTLSAPAQHSYRLQDLANQLQRNADEVAEKAYTDFTSRFSNSRSDIDNLFLAQQLKASAEIFRRMVNDNRPNAELRDASNTLSEIARRGLSSDYSSQRRQLLKNLDDISHELGSYGGGDKNNDDNDQDVIGRVRWRGTVDDEVNLVIRGDSVEVQNISGTAYSNGTYNFTSALPNRKVTVHLDKKKGRGSAKVIQVPSRENNFTIVIQIRDKDGGARDYDLDIYWTR